MNHDTYKDTLGRYLTQSLFYEYAGKGAPFTLKPYDHDGSVSMKQLYLAANDPTEYKFAIEVLGSWEHWQKLISSDWFHSYVAAWRDELEVKLRSEAIVSIHKQANENVSAAKWIAEKQYAQKGKVGRPTKEETAHTKKVQAMIDQETEEELNRLGIRFN